MLDAGFPQSSPCTPVLNLFAGHPSWYSFQVIRSSGRRYSLTLFGLSEPSFRLVHRLPRILAQFRFSRASLSIRSWTIDILRSLLSIQSLRTHSHGHMPNIARTIELFTNYLPISCHCQSLHHACTILLPDQKLVYCRRVLKSKQLIK